MTSGIFKEKVIWKLSTNTVEKHNAMIMLFVKVSHCVVMNLVTFSWRVETGSTALLSTALSLSLPVLRYLSRHTDSGFA